VRGLGLRATGEAAATPRDWSEGNPEMRRTELSFSELAAALSGARRTDPRGAREDDGGSLRAKDAMVKEAICFLVLLLYSAVRFF